jgi:hypothetical protein
MRVSARRESSDGVARDATLSLPERALAVPAPRAGAQVVENTAESRGESSANLARALYPG